MERHFLVNTTEKKKKVILNQSTIIKPVVECIVMTNFAHDHAKKCRPYLPQADLKLTRKRQMAAGTADS